MKELGSCPMCNGWDIRLRQGNHSSTSHRVECDDCFLTTGDCISVEAAASTWNKRPIEESLRRTITIQDEKIDRLVNEVEQMRKRVRELRAQIKKLKAR